MTVSAEPIYQCDGCGYRRETPYQEVRRSPGRGEEHLCSTCSDLLNRILDAKCLRVVGEFVQRVHEIGWQSGRKDSEKRS